MGPSSAFATHTHRAVSTMSAFEDKGAAATTVYNPYKIFQAAQRCMGDPSMVAKVLVELLGDCATQDVLMGAAAHVLSLYYGKGGLRVCSMTDFGKFAGELAEELGKRNSPEASRSNDCSSPAAPKAYWGVVVVVL